MRRWTSLRWSRRALAERFVLEMRRGDAAEIHAVFTHSSPRAPPDAGAHAEDGGRQPQVRRRAGGERLQNRVPSRVLAVNRSADGPTEQLALASVDVAVNATPLTARNSHTCPPPTAAAAPSPPQAYVNGVPTFVLNLVANGPGGQRVYQLGSGLSEQELEWIAAEVNATLEEVESNPPEPLL